MFQIRWEAKAQVKGNLLWLSGLRTARVTELAELCFPHH